MYKKTAIALISAAILAAIAGCGPKDSAPQVTTVVSNTCHLDAINGKGDPLVHVKASVVTFGGWSADSTTNTVPAKLQMVLKDSGGFSYSLDITQRHERPDVASFFKQDGFLKSGFSLEADLSSLKPGVYAIFTKMSDNGRVAICQIRKNIIID